MPGPIATLLDRASQAFSLQPVLPAAWTLVPPAARWCVLLAAGLLALPAVGCSNAPGAPPSPGPGESADGGGQEGEGEAVGEGEGEGMGEGEGEGEEEGMGEPCLDLDGDRYGTGPGCLGPDCREGDRWAYPGAGERCNGQDDDCDDIADPCQCIPWLGTAGCPEGQHCAASGPESVARCVQLPVGEPVDDGQPCGPPPCHPGSQCVAWSEGASCTHTCDPYSGEGCAAPQECLAHLASNEAIGLCRQPPPPCDVYEPRSCPDDQACRPLFRRWGAADLRCQSAGPRRVGESCGGEDGECTAGLICVRDSETSLRSCYLVCKEDAECSPLGLSCRGRTVTLGVRYCR